MRRSLTVLLAVLLLPACARDSGGSGSADDGAETKLAVVTAVYPMTYVAQRVGGGDVTVVDVAPPGAEPHDVELTPAQAGEVAQADVVLLVGGLQPAVDAAAPDDRTVDALVVAGGTDPHVWLDPTALAEVGGALAAELAERDPRNAAAYTERAEALRSDLTAFDARTQAALKACPRKDLVTSHAAFGRFAERYALRETGIAGVDAEAEPSPRRLADVAAFVRENGVTTVFAESDESRPARTVAREAGVKVAVLDPVEVFRGDDYLTVMRRNVEAVATALGCA